MSSFDGDRVVLHPFPQPSSTGDHVVVTLECDTLCSDNFQILSENGVATVAGQAIERLSFIDSVINGRMVWEDVEEKFNGTTFINSNCIPVVNRSDFACYIGMEETPDLADQLLVALRGTEEGQLHITKTELRDYWCRITDPSFDSRTRLFFDLCDQNMDGKINEREIKQVILLSTLANKLSLTQEEAEEYASLIMEELDRDNRGYIELSQLKELFKQVSLKVSHLNNDIPNSPSIDSSDQQREPMSSLEVLFRTYWRRAWIVTCWLLVCLGLFVWKFLQYRNRKAFEVMGYCICTSKGAAETLKFNMALILLPVCRNTITWLRKNRSFNSIIPFNDNINFHKLIAGGIVVGVILHGGTHLTCDFPRIAGCSSRIFRITISADFQHHQPSYVEILATTEVVTGIAMVILMAIAFSLATKMPRREPSSLPSPLRQVTGFNTFWYSHHLFVFVYALLIVHSMFLFLTKAVTEKSVSRFLTNGVSYYVLIYTGERAVRALRSGFYDVKIIKATTYPGKVLSLKVSKPTGFQYRSGMYVYLQCPQISSFEWHPFSLTSAPDDDHLSVHIRTLGDWSYQTYSLFQETLISGSPNYPRIYVDGPYGAAAQDHVKYDIIVLIGLGIGATPFISVIRDILHSLQFTINDEESGDTKGPSKAYFYWVTREQSSFEWFIDVMKEISETTPRQTVIEMHSFLTSVYKDQDARSSLLTAIQALHYAKHGVDVLCGTPVRTHFGRPNWSKVITKLAHRHERTKIGVFYCGPSALAKELKKLCIKITSKTTTRFVFHKENY
ncbi:hypothetical protein GIB67_000636 [Kingdonia uniflora]|uniref:Uncharacterized protein n=1 Tax=Kingdonia uniflora TaxID=39325 RepID=A0A7J7NDJ9_9MAGN|nr:hypothetical protein GIB67_000636 [Kingdonia uniflora]